MQDIRSDKDCKGLYQHSSSAALLFLSPNANHLNTWLDSFLLFKIYLKSGIYLSTIQTEMAIQIPTKF